MRRATVEAQLAFHLGCAQDAIALTTPMMPLLDDVDDPLARTSFLFTRALALNAGAHYRAGLEVIAALERDATEYRIAFAVPAARLARAAGEAGLRNFVRARHVVRDVIGRGRNRSAIFLPSQMPRRLRHVSRSVLRLGQALGFGSDLGDQSNVWGLRRICPVTGTGRSPPANRTCACALRNSCTRRYVTTEAEVLSAWVEADDTAVQPKRRVRARLS